MSKRFAATEKTRLQRRPQRGSYDRDIVFGILDAGIVCHIAYVVDGQPYCTPTAYWRQDDRIYWHGSAGSRMQQVQASGIKVCLTVSHLDGLVLGRCGFTHSILYRSVMLFGCPIAVTGKLEKRRQMDFFINRLYPGRTGELRAAYDSELEAISMVSMAIEEVSAKIRDGGALDSDSELDAPCWAGVVPIVPTIGQPIADARLPSATVRPPSLDAYLPSAPLAEILSDQARRLPEDA